jgi:hypothetical protein
MKSGRHFFMIMILLIAAFMVFPCFLRNAEAGPRGGRAVQGPRGNVAVEGPRGNVVVGTRYTGLPASAKALILNNRTYYVDDTYVYYLPCDDDKTGFCPCDGDDKVFCVVPAPE